MITQTINLNLIPGGVLPRINVSQYDKGARTLQFNLYNGVTPFTIPSGSSVYVVGTKADKTGFDYEATYTGGLVSIDVTEQMTAFAGDVEIEIRIIKSGEQIATGNFILCVERTALADDTVISETDIPIIQHLPELVAETEENAELAHKWATFGDESEEPSATNNAKYWAEQAEAAQDLTYDTATGNPVSFTTDSSGISKDTIVTLEPIQNLHGYDHPWPAGGGKNLLPMTVSRIKSANTSGSWSGDAYTIDGVTLTILSDADGNVTGIKANGTATNVVYFNLTPVSGVLFKAGDYILNGGKSANYMIYDGNSIYSQGSDATFSLSSDTSKRWIIRIANGLSVNNSICYPMIRLATEKDSTFAPYSNICPISGYDEIEVNGSGHRITSPLPSTIYGGTYDVETGELTVDRALVDLGTLNWTTTITSISNKPRMSSTNIANEIKKPSSDNSPFNGNCSQYKIVSNNSTFYNTVGVGVSASTGNLFIYDDRYTDAATFKAAMSGVQLAYELETPYTISLEPHLLNLFEGQNNVSTNGTQISVTYRNGIVARVDDFDAVGESFEALADKVEAVETDKAESSALAPVENGATASKAYAVGEHFYRDGAFCTAKTAITQGAQFTLGTNYTAGNIADRFNGIEVTNDNGVSGVIDQIKASFNSASNYSIYQGATSGGKEAGWYGFRRSATKSSSALVLMDVHLYKLVKLANEDTWKMYLIS